MPEARYVSQLICNMPVLRVTSRALGLATDSLLVQSDWLHFIVRPDHPRSDWLLVPAIPGGGLSGPTLRLDCWPSWHACLQVSHARISTATEQAFLQRVLQPLEKRDHHSGGMVSHSAESRASRRLCALGAVDEVE